MRKLSITVSDAFYDGLRRTVGSRRMGRFVEQATTPHLAPDLDAECGAMASDGRREAEARAWIGADTGDALPEDDWSWLRDEERRGLVGELRPYPRLGDR